MRRFFLQLRGEDLWCIGTLRGGSFSGSTSGIQRLCGVELVEVLWCGACGGSALKIRRFCGTTSCSSYLHYGFKSKRSFVI